jgi:small multidrug resistance pump
MTPLLSAYSVLGAAIVLEVIGTTFLHKSEQFTRFGPTLIMALCYLVAFYFLSLALRVIPVGLAYAIWSGLGIVLISAIGYFVFRQTLDLAAIIGLGFIVVGVVIVNVFSKSITL